MSDAYYTTPGYAPTGTEMPMTPAQRYQQMLAKNPLQLGLEQRGPSYSYYGPYNGGYAPVPLPLAKGQPANSYDAYAAVAPQSEDPPVDNPTSPPPPPPPPVDNPTSPPPPPPPPTTTPAGPQSFKKLQPQIQGAMQSAFKDYLNNTVGQKSNGSFPNLFGVLDQFALKRPKPPSSTPTSPPTSPPPPPPPPPADAPQKSSALATASFPTSGSGGSSLLLNRMSGPVRRAAGGMSNPGMSSVGMSNPGMSSVGMSNPGMSSVGMSNPGMSSVGMSNPGMSNAQPMPMPTIPAGAVRPPPMTAAPGGGGAPPPVLGGNLPSYGDPGPSQGQGNAWGRNRPAGMKPFDMAGFGGRGPNMSRPGRTPLR